MPDTYFCLVGDEWRPRLIDDPNLPRCFVPQFAHRRDQLVVRILFESGARIGEVLALTVGDWRHFGLQPRATATNKGDGVVRRTSKIWWTLFGLWTDWITSISRFFPPIRTSFQSTWWM